MGWLNHIDIVVSCVEDGSGGRLRSDDFSTGVQIPIEACHHTAANHLCKVCSYNVSWSVDANVAT
jgi:hypothetical protein